MKTSSTIGVAFLGVGRMGETHLRNLGGLSDVQVIVVADANLQSAEYGKRLSGAEIATTDIEQAINHPSVDAVVIVTPTDTHARLIELAIRAGKAVFSEKPIAWISPKPREWSTLLANQGRRFNSGLCAGMIRVTFRPNNESMPENSVGSKRFERLVEILIRRVSNFFDRAADSFSIWRFTILIWLVFWLAK